MTPPLSPESPLHNMIPIAIVGAMVLTTWSVFSESARFSRQKAEADIQWIEHQATIARDEALFDNYALCLSFPTCPSQGACIPPGGCDALKAQLPTFEP